MSSRYYILRDGQVVPSTSYEWARWLEADKDNSRQIAVDQLGDNRVSTVFLGLDHSYGGEGLPLIFETMVFEGVHDGYQERYSTLEEALAGHKATCEMVDLTRAAAFAFTEGGAA